MRALNSISVSEILCCHSQLALSSVYIRVFVVPQKLTLVLANRKGLHWKNTGWLRESIEGLKDQTQEIT